MPTRDTVCKECSRVFYAPARGKCPFCRSNQVRLITALDATDSVKLLRSLVAEATEDGDTEAAAALQRVLDRYEVPSKSLTERVFEAITDSYRRAYGTESVN